MTSNSLHSVRSLNERSEQDPDPFFISSEISEYAAEAFVHEEHPAAMAANSDQVEPIEQFGADENSRAPNEEQPPKRTAGGTFDLVREIGASQSAVLISFLEAFSGAGFLALPLAFKEAGHWSGLMLLVAAILSCYCMTQLVACAQFHYVRLDVPYLSYGNLAKEACRNSFPWLRPHGILAKRIVNASVLVLGFGFSSTYYLFIATTLKELLCVLNIEAWLAIIFIPIAVLTFIRSLRVLSVFSLIGNVLMLISLAFILYKLIVNWQPIENPNSWDSVDSLITAYGAVVFSFGAMSLVLTLEKKLKRPKQMLGFCGILSHSTFIATIFYGSVGFLGYVASAQYAWIRVTLILYILSCFLLQMNGNVELLWPKVARMLFVCDNVLCELLFRVLMVTMCFSFSIAVPYLDIIIPLVGSTAGMLVVFIFPAFINLFTFVPFLLQKGQKRKAYLQVWLNILLVCVGLVGMVAGLKANVSNMMEEKKNSTNIAC